MNATSCSVDPLQRFASLQNNNANTFSNGSSSSTGSSSAHRGVEQGFFNNQDAAYHHMSAPLPSPPQEEGDLVIPEFANVRINDPMEFSDQYKRLYGSYVQTPTPPASSSHTPMAHPLASMPRPPIQRFRQYKQPRTVGQVPMNIPSALIDQELNALEQELQNSTPRGMSQEQMQFRQAATGIVHSLEATTPEPSRSSTPLESRLGGSKFIQLMRQVSAGSVTLRSGSPELCSPDTDERVGNEYFPVLDDN